MTLCGLMFGFETPKESTKEGRTLVVEHWQKTLVLIAHISIHAFPNIRSQAWYAKVQLPVMVVSRTEQGRPIWLVPVLEEKPVRHQHVL